MAEEKDQASGQKDAAGKKRDKKKEDLEKREIDQEDLLGLGDIGPTVSSPSPSQGGSKAPVDDLLNIGLNDESPAPTPTQNQFTFNKQMTPSSPGLNDFLDLSGSTNQAQSFNSFASSPVKQPTMEIVLPRMQSGMSGKNGVEIMGCVQASGNGFLLHLNFRTMVPSPISINQVSIMTNSMGLGGNYPSGSVAIPPNGSADVIVPLMKQGGGQYTSMLNLQIGTSYDSYISSVPVYPHILATQNPVSIEEFKQGWMSTQGTTVDQPMIPPLLNQDEQLKQVFRQNGIHHLSTQAPGGISRHQ